MERSCCTHHDVTTCRSHGRVACAGTTHSNSSAFDGGSITTVWMWATSPKKHARTFATCDVYAHCAIAVPSFSLGRFAVLQDDARWWRRTHPTVTMAGRPSTGCMHAPSVAAIHRPACATARFSARGVDPQQTPGVRRRTVFLLIPPLSHRVSAADARARAPSTTKRLLRFVPEASQHVARPRPSHLVARVRRRWGCIRTSSHPGWNPVSFGFERGFVSDETGMDAGGNRGHPCWGGNERDSWVR